jgi:hypothetical protein
MQTVFVYTTILYTVRLVQISAVNSCHNSDTTDTFYLQDNTALLTDKAWCQSKSALLL